MSSWMAATSSATRASAGPVFAGWAWAWPTRLRVSTLNPELVAAELVARLKERGQTVAVAESTAGGLVLAALIAVPGASAVTPGGLVAYANTPKIDLLGVSRDLLRAHGAVSAECAIAMAEGARRLFGTDWGL